MEITTELKLKVMFWYTLVASFAFGVLMLVAPAFVIETMGWPVQDPLIFGLMASLFTAEGIWSIFGIKNPRKFIPVLLMQMTYKLIWFVAVVLPTIITKTYYLESLLFTIVLGTYVIGDLVAIPFKEFLAPGSNT